MHDWLFHGQWLGNSILAWIIAGAGALCGYAIAQSIALFLKARLGRLADRTHPGLHVVAAVAAATRGWLLLLIAIVVALDFLQLGSSAAASTHVQRALDLLTWILVGMQVAFWINALLVAWLRRSASGNGRQTVNQVMLGVVTWIVQFVVWVTLVLILLDQGGVRISAFVASLGVGGVAVALALQNVLVDLFSSIAIGLDKPFVVGEFIAFGGDLGTVTKVGIKSTRINSLSGEELAISNSQLLKNLIHNYSRMQQRRVVFHFRLPFGTPRDKLPTIAERVKGIVQAETRTRFDRGHLATFGEYGLEFEVVYYVLDPSYNVFMDIQQRINIRILELCDELGVRIALPARELHTPANNAPVVQVSGVSQ
ncbi:MAG: mechanosensitive ion channel family protein [Rhodanobacteraceae bacterium]